jgi:hypothetical protein
MPIGGVFADSKRLVVPIYQRTYEWTPERQIDTLMDYVEAKAEARLANESARFLHYIHVLGNLTLLTKPANLEVYNYGFDSEKKSRLRASLLRINQDVAAETKWDEDAIVRRAQRLAQLAIKIWPAPNAVETPAALQGELE